MSLKIAIVVHGRFHAFDLARALLKRGHDVTLFTNYPKRIVERFGVDRRHVRSFVTHGVLSRAAAWLHKKAGLPYPEAWVHRLFGRWAARRLTQEAWDVVHCFSGVAEEPFRALQTHEAQTILMRGSSHIRTQARLLEEEQQRAGTPLSRPSSWMIAREEREYAFSDRIAVLSSFAYRSFVEEGVEPARLVQHPLSAEMETFRLDPETIEARCRRIESGRPLRVLYVSTLGYRKGILDLLQIVQRLSEERFQFRLVGPVAPEVADLVEKLKDVAEVVPKQPQHELPKQYAWGDLFLFPTIEDGFAVVLSQAQAGGLPMLATTNCSAPDIVREGETGWVLPIRSPEAFIERLRWCEAHREDVADMVRAAYQSFASKTWDDVAADFEAICRDVVAS